MPLGNAGDTAGEQCLNVLRGRHLGDRRSRVAIGGWHPCAFLDGQKMGKFFTRNLSDSRLIARVYIAPGMRNPLLRLRCATGETLEELRDTADVQQSPYSAQACGTSK